MTEYPFTQKHGVKCHFQQYFSYIAAASAPIHPLLEFNSLPNSKIFDQSEVKALPDDTINVTQKLKFVLERVENILEKEKMLVSSAVSFS